MLRNLTILLVTLLAFALVAGDTFSEQIGDANASLEAVLAKYRTASAADTAESWQVCAQAARELAQSSADYLTRCAASQLYLSSYSEVVTDFEGLLGVRLEAARRSSPDIKGDWFNAVDISADNSRLLLLDRDTVRVYSTADLSLVASSKPSYEPSEGACFSRDGAKIYFAQTSAIAVLDANTCEQIGVLRGTEGSECFLDLSPDGRYLAATDRDKRSILVFDLTTGKLLHENPSGDTWLRKLSFSQDSKYITYVGNECVQVREVATNRLVKECPDAQGGAFSPCGKYFYAGNEICDLETTAVVSTISLPEGQYYGGSAFSSDSSMLFVLTKSQCDVYSTTTGKLQKTIPIRGIEYFRQVIPVYSRGLIVLVGADNAHALLSASTGEYVGMPTADESKYHARVSADGQYMVTAQQKEVGIVYLPVYEKPISDLLSSALKKGWPDYTNLLAPAVEAAGKGDVATALRLARRGAVEVFRRGDKRGYAAAVDLLTAVSKLAGSEDPSLQSAKIQDMISISTDGQPVIGIGFRDGAIAYATKSRIQFDPPEGDRIKTFEISVPDGKEVFFSNWCASMVAPAEKGCRVVYRGCHDGEFDFAVGHEITGVAFSDRGMEAILFTSKGFITAEFWTANICSYFPIPGANERNAQMFDGSVVTSESKNISFREYDDNTVNNAPLLKPKAYFTIANPFSADLAAIRCDVEWKLLAASSTEGEVAVWDVNFGRWRGAMPSWSDDPPSYDPEKGKVHLLKFASGVADASVIRWFFHENKAYLAVVCETSGEFAIHSYPDGRQVHKGKTLPGRLYALASPEVSRSDVNRTAHIPSPVFFVTRAQKGFGVVNVLTGESASFDAGDTIRTVRFAPNGDMLAYGTESGKVKFCFLPALFVR